MYLHQTRAGFFAVALSAVIWGVSPLFYAALNKVDPLEVIAHRTIWTAVVLIAFLAWQRRVFVLWTPLRRKRDMKIIAVSSLMILMNWGGFIWAVQIERVLEASFGYYIMPLMAVFLGAFFLGERHERLKWIAVGLAALGVVMVALGLKMVPWLALFLSSTFAIYGLLKTSLKTHPLVSVTLEALLIAPFALVILGGIYIAEWPSLFEGRLSAVFGADLRLSLFLALSGVVTGLPLVLFTYGSRRMTYGATGLTSYINPSLQFLCAIFLLGEGFSWWHFIAFSLIWIALALYSWAALSGGR